MSFRAVSVLQAKTTGADRCSHSIGLEPIRFRRRSWRWRKLRLPHPAHRASRGIDKSVRGAYPRIVLLDPERALPIFRSDRRVRSGLRRASTMSTFPDTVRTSSAPRQQVCQDRFFLVRQPAADDEGAQHGTRFGCVRRSSEHRSMSTLPAGSVSTERR